jgi:hypothetical protein
MKAKPSSGAKLLLLIPILGTVLISGCITGGGGPTFGNGVVILNWEPTFSQVDSGDKLQLRLRVQNQGEAVAANVNPVLAGIDTSEWATSTASSFITNSNLLPPDRVQGTSGEIREKIFDLTAPRLPKGTTQQYSPQVRVFYDYRTTAIKSITLVNENELRRLQDQGKTLSSTDTKTSAGPLKVTVTTGKFIKAREASYYSNTFPITIDIQNTGGGVVGRYNMPQDDYKVGVDIKWPSRLSPDAFACGNFANNVLLWKGQSASITCNMRINSPPPTNEDANIQVILTYGYYVDSTTTITVVGQEQSFY